MDAFHDIDQELLELFFLPADPRRILAHLEAGDRDTACVCRLAWGKQNLGILENVDAVERGRHVGAFRYRDAAIRDERFGIFGIELILRGAWQRDVARHAPWRLARGKGRTRELVGIFANAAAADVLEVLDPVDLLLIEPCGVVDEALAVRKRHCLTAKHGDFLCRVRCDIARSGDHRRFADEVVALGLEHVKKKIDRAIARRLGANQRSAIFKALAGENTGEFIGQPLILAEHIADFARADSDVACGNVGISADVTIELVHEALAETHDFAVALALGVEVRPALAAAHGKPGQSVLEGLFKSQKLKCAFGYARVEADAALVWADRVIVLHAPAALHANVAIIILPADAE